MHHFRNLNAEISPPVQLAVATGEDALISATPVRAPQSPQPFAKRPVTVENYQIGLQSIRDGVKREFPEMAGRVAVADLSLANTEAVIKNTAIQLNLQNDPGFADRMRDEVARDGQLAEGRSFSYTAPDGKYYSVAVGNRPEHYSNMGDVMWHNLHETGHALDTDLRNAAANSDANALMTLAKQNVRYESFAETFARTAMVVNGLADRSHIAEAYAHYAARFGAPHISGPYDRYQPYEALSYVDSQLKGSYPTNTDGKISDLRSTYKLAKAGMDVGGYAPHDTLARAEIEGTYVSMFTDFLEGNEKFSREWLRAHDKMPEADRTIRAQDYLDHKVPSPYTPWQRPDFVKGYAQALVYMHDRPADFLMPQVAEAYRNVARMQSGIQGPSNFTEEVAFKLDNDINLARRIANGGSQVELYKTPGQTKAPATGPGLMPTSKPGFSP